MQQSCTPLYVTIGNCEANAQRITAVEKLFGFPSKRLHTPRRVLVGEGTLTKICKRKPKQRHFFLFNDILLYGSILLQRRLQSPHFIDLIDTEVADVGDNGIYQNGFSVLNPRKSFTLYATTSDEKLQWIVHLRRCISEARLLAGFIGTPSVKHSPVWIPDSETSSCMACHSTLFTVFQRKHHCRHCGKVVCQKCSRHRLILPYQGSSPVRVCEPCHTLLKCKEPSWDHVLHQLDSAPIPLRSNTMRFFASSDTDSIMFTDSSPQATRRPLWSPTLDAIHPDAS